MRLFDVCPYAFEWALGREEGKGGLILDIATSQDLSTHIL